jgi:hypothetical protein
VPTTIFFTLLTMTLVQPAFASDTDTDSGEDTEPVVDTDSDFGITQGAADLAGEAGGMDCSAAATGWGTAGLVALSMLLVWRERRGSR